MAADGDHADHAGASQEYVMLGSGTCDKPLPQHTILRELSFGRFITLASDAVPASGALSGVAREVVLPLHFIAPQLSAGGEGAAADIVPVDALMLASDEESHDELMVQVSNVAALVASKRIAVGDAHAEVALPGVAISELVYGGSTVVALYGIEGHSTVRLDASNADDAQKVAVAAAHVVHDVGEFLAQPVVLAPDGQAVTLELDPQNVTDLLNSRTTQVSLGRQVVSLSPHVAHEDDSDPQATTTATYAMHATEDTLRRKQSGKWLSAMQATITTPAPESDPTTATVAPPNPQSTSRTSAETPRRTAPQIGFYVPYTQTWTLLGYSRGALLNTIALSPQEEVTIELFTWDRRTDALEQTSSSEVEQNIESTDATKDTKQVADELTHDSHFNADAHMHAQVNVQAFQVGGDAGGGVGGAAKDGAKKTTDFIHEQTSKAVTRVKASRQSKVSESHQFGSEERTTRKVKNVNMCRTLHLDYFEVLVDYLMKTVCNRKDAQLVVLLDNPCTWNWTRQNIRRFESILKPLLLDRAFVAGFEASRLLAARDAAFATVCERSHCPDDGSDVITSDSTELDDLRAAAFGILIRVPALVTYEDSGIPLRALLMVAPPDPQDAIPDPGGFQKSVQLWAFVQQIQSHAASVWSGLKSLAAAGIPTGPEQISVQRLRAMHGVLTQPAGGTATPIANVMVLDEPAKAELRGIVHGIAMGVYKDVGRQQLDTIATATALAIPDPIIAGITLLINKLAAGAAQAAITELAAQLGVAAVDAKYSLTKLDDSGLVGAIATFSEAWAAWLEASANVLKHTEAVATALDTLANTRDDQIRSAYPLATVAEAREREDALQMHLQDNNAYYSFGIYQAQLASGTECIPTEVNMSNGLISPAAMGMVNGKLAFPVNVDDLPIASDPAKVKALREWFDSEIRDNQDLDNGPDATPISMPTPGITLETRLGACDGCEEFVMKTRSADVRQRVATARQAEAEAKRRELRVDADDPDLTDPAPEHAVPALTVRWVNETPPPPAQPPPAQPPPAAPPGN